MIKIAEGGLQGLQVQIADGSEVFDVTGQEDGMASQGCGSNERIGGRHWITRRRKAPARRAIWDVTATRGNSSNNSMTCRSSLEVRTGVLNNSHSVITEIVALTRPLWIFCSS